MQIINNTNKIPRTHDMRKLHWFLLYSNAHKKKIVAKSVSFDEFEYENAQIDMKLI